MFLFTILLYSCGEKEVVQKEQVSFAITPKVEGDANGKTQSADLPAGTSLLISITDASGNPVLTRHKINILHLGNSYLTDPLELTPGRYTLTDFLLENDSEVLYATPQRNSKLSKIVSRPLPYSFVIGRNKVNNVEMEVVDAKLNQPQDFGYASFGIVVVQPLQVSVFVRQDDKLVLTDAKASISNYDDYPGEAVMKYDLDATINLISLKGGAESTYYLSISKEGYNTYYKSFTYTELLAELDGKPLKVVLQERSLRYWDASVVTTLSYNASGTLFVDYGNGDTEVRPLDYRADHEGETDGNWIYLATTGEPTNTQVTITGSLSVVTGIYQYMPGNIDLSALTSLESITFEEGYMARLNLTNNKALTYLYLYNTSIDELIFPAEHHINYLFIGGETTYREAAIEAVYNNAVVKNIMGGQIDIDETFAPLPEETQAQLDILKNEYGWSIQQYVE
jgi:hypothetical protein